MGDAHRLLGGGGEVRRDVRLWIHHSARSGAPSAEDIAGAARGGRKKVTEDLRTARDIFCTTSAFSTGSHIVGAEVGESGAAGPPDAGEKVVVTPQIGGGFSVGGR